MSKQQRQARIVRMATEMGISRREAAKRIDEFNRNRRRGKVAPPAAPVTSEETFDLDAPVDEDSLEALRAKLRGTNPRDVIGPSLRERLRPLRELLGLNIRDRIVGNLDALKPSELAAMKSPFAGLTLKELLEKTSGLAHTQGMVASLQKPLADVQRLGELLAPARAFAAKYGGNETRSAAEQVAELAAKIAVPSAVEQAMAAADRITGADSAVARAAEMTNAAMPPESVAAIAATARVLSNAQAAHIAQASWRGKAAHAVAVSSANNAAESAAAISAAIAAGDIPTDDEA